MLEMAEQAEQHNVKLVNFHSVFSSSMEIPWLKMHPDRSWNKCIFLPCRCVRLMQQSICSFIFFLKQLLAVMLVIIFKLVVVRIIGPFETANVAVRKRVIIAEYKYMWPRVDLKSIWPMQVDLSLNLMQHIIFYWCVQEQYKIIKKAT